MKTVRWEDDGGDTIKGYDVKYGIKGSQQYCEVSKKPNDRSAVFEDLTRNTQYNTQSVSERLTAISMVNEDRFLLQHYTEFCNHTPEGWCPSVEGVSVMEVGLKTKKANTIWSSLRP